MAEEDKNKEVMEIVKEIHEKTKKFGEESAEVKELIAKTEATLDAQETKNQELMASITEEKAAREELGEKYDALQVEMARKVSSNKLDYKETDEYKALNFLCQYGEDKMDVDQKALIRSDDDTSGGFLVTIEMDTSIIRKITEISDVRRVARVRTVSKKTLEMPKRGSIPTATYEGEAAAGGESQSTYESELMTAHRLTVTIPVTQDMMLSTDFDIESEISQDVAESFAQKEGQKFVVGTGAGEPEGFLVDATVVAGARITANSGAIAVNDLIDLTGDLKVGYNPTYAFNRRTLAKLRQLAGGDGQLIWQAGLAPTVPNTINGDPYVIMEDMPDIAAGNLAVMFADFFRGYTIIDRTGTSVIRDPFTSKKQNIIELTFHRYNTGQVVLQEAFKALKIKA
ncbi:MAG: phage major capsid protein [Candidatus Anammoxibacter sp.]